MNLLSWSTKLVADRGGGNVAIGNVRKRSGRFLIYYWQWEYTFCGKKTEPDSSQQCSVTGQEAMGGSLNLPEHKKALFHSELQMTLDNLHWAGGWTGWLSEASNLNYSVITPTWLTLGSQMGNVPPEVPFLITSGFGCCKASLSRKLFSSPEDISSMHHALWCTFMPHVPPLTFQVPKQFQRWGTHLTRIHFFCPWGLLEFFCEQFLVLLTTTL